MPLPYSTGPRYTENPDILDYSASRDNAALLCTEIMAYWHRMGFPEVKAWPVSYGKEYHRILWGVQSNLEGGLPPQAEE